MKPFLVLLTVFVVMMILCGFSYDSQEKACRLTCGGQPSHLKSVYKSGYECYCRGDDGRWTLNFGDDQ